MAKSGCDGPHETRVAVGQGVVPVTKVTRHDHNRPDAGLLQAHDRLLHDGSTTQLQKSLRHQPTRFSQARARSRGQDDRHLDRGTHEVAPCKHTARRFLSLFMSESRMSPMQEIRKISLANEPWPE